MKSESKLIVITGATRGLGLSISKNLLLSNYKIVGISRTESKEFEKLRHSASDRAHFVEADLSATGSICDLCKSIQKKFGRLYGLVNNAAIGVDGVLPTMHESDIDKMIRVNLHAPLLLCKYLSRGMLINRSGRIINVSSIIASTGFSGLSVYGATKSSLIGFSKSLARELGKANVTVNCVAPGYMDTDMTRGLEDEKLESIRRRSPLQRFSTTDEVAKSIKFLLSNDASAVTGTILTVDAGSTA
jgi:3-oxoacyl-[acyl-carrier protein] reductase